jgi:hypothetical protein
LEGVAGFLASSVRLDEVGQADPLVGVGASVLGRYQVEVEVGMLVAHLDC